MNEYDYNIDDDHRPGWNRAFAHSGVFPGWNQACFGRSCCHSYLPGDYLDYHAPEEYLGDYFRDCFYYDLAAGVVIDINQVIILMTAPSMQQAKMMMMMKMMTIQMKTTRSINKNATGEQRGRLQI